MDKHDLGYELTVKEIDQNGKYEILEIAGLSGLGIDKVKNLVAAGTLSVDPQKRIQGADFLNWVEQNNLPVKKQ